MTTQRGALAVIPVLALTLAIALTGCGKLGASAGSGPDESSVSNAPSGSSSTSAPGTSAPAVDDSAAVDGITQDLDSADSANTEAGSNADAGDQAGATSDEPSK